MLRKKPLLLFVECTGEGEDQYVSVKIQHSISRPYGSHDDPEAPSAPARRIDTLEFVCGGKPFAGSPATSDSFEVAPMIAQIP